MGVMSINQSETLELEKKLRTVVGADRLVTDLDERKWLSQDAFWDDAVASLAIRPENKTQTCSALAIASASGFAIVPRGGGMSYTGGYVPNRAKSLLIDCRDLNRIREINIDDMYVTAEAGCTWMQLYEALKHRGLRTPYFGPMSGMFATLGGALSQNSMFYGSATYGTVAESVLGLEIALADGRRISTGSRSIRGGTPFFRHYGPDLTGLFLSDSGALGLKLEATVRLIRTPAFTEYGSFEFDSFADMVDVQAETDRAGLASECFGLDPYLKTKRTMTKGLKESFGTLADVVDSQSSVLKGLREATTVAAAGIKGLSQGINYSLHVTCESMSASDAAWRLAEVRRLADTSGREIEPIVPKVLRANPFKHVGEFLVGHAGERWVPIHAYLPASKVKPVFAATMAYFESKRRTLEEFGIETSHLTGCSGKDIVFEPAFYYPDALKPFHLRNLESGDAKRYHDLPPAPGATNAVTGMLQDLAKLFAKHGAASQQIGKFYPYKEAIKRDSWVILEGIKQLVDRRGLMNPGSLGL